MSSYRIENRSTGDDEFFDDYESLTDYCNNHKKDELLYFEIGRWGETEFYINGNQQDI